jgi:hypothetical protein
VFGSGNRGFIAQVTEILQSFPEHGTLSQQHIYLARIVGENFRLFLTHSHCYPPRAEQDLRQIALIASTLFVYARFSPEDFQIAPRHLIDRLRMANRELQTYDVNPPATFSVFHNSEYLHIMRMLSVCDPDLYIKQYLPTQIEQIHKSSNLRTPIGAMQISNLFPYYQDVVFPLFNAAIEIIRDRPEAVRAFCEQFCRRMFPLSALSDARSLFHHHRKYLPCVWAMTSELPPYVMQLSNAFITHYKDHLTHEMKGHNHAAVTNYVTEINQLVDCEFGGHETMILARSALLIPHQRDSELIGRARFLVEQAHYPPKMNYSIAELFDIVPFVKNRQGLFEGIHDFLQHQLLAQIEPSVELERRIVDAMG